MYHHISPTPGPFTVSPDRFRSQIAWLAQSDYRVLTGNDLIRLRRGEERLDKPAVMLTFDDGWLDNWVYAFPVLKAFEIPATWFIVTAWIGEGEQRSFETDGKWQVPAHTKAMQLAADPVARDEVMMRWSELLAAKDSGLIHLENHSHSHGQWWQQSSWQGVKKAFVTDLDDSISVFRTRIGSNPKQFCWPKGQFSHTLTNLVWERGIEVQHSVLRGNNSIKDNSLIRRINVENQAAEWLERQLRFYNIPGVGAGLGSLHGWIQGRRLSRQFQGRIPSHEFSPLWRTKSLAKS